VPACTRLSSESFAWCLLAVARDSGLNFLSSGVSAISLIPSGDPCWFPVFDDRQKVILLISSCPFDLGISTGWFLR
jgi:hypothetical protein